MPRLAVSFSLVVLAIIAHQATGQCISWRETLGAPLDMWSMARKEREEEGTGHIGECHQGCKHRDLKGKKNIIASLRHKY